MVVEIWASNILILLLQQSTMLRYHFEHISIVSQYCPAIFGSKNYGKYMKRLVSLDAFDGERVS